VGDARHLLHGGIGLTLGLGGGRRPVKVTRDTWRVLLPLAGRLLLAGAVTALIMGGLPTFLSIAASASVR
jgi:hypothetical protein